MAVKKQRGKNANSNIKQLTTQIMDNEKTLSQNRATDTKTAVKQGKYFIRLKRLLKKKKMPFREYNKKNFPGLRSKTIQRYINLARYVKLKEFPVLSVLSQNKLYILFTINGNKNVGKYLMKNNFDLEFDPKNFEECAEFRITVDDFIKNNKKSAKKSGKKTKSHEHVIKLAMTTVSEFASKNIAKKSPLPKKKIKIIKKLRDLLTELLAISNSDK